MAGPTSRNEECGRPAGKKEKKYIFIIKYNSVENYKHTQKRSVFFLNSKITRA
jgi:hypothetical protein